jgi:hypothetical protein
MTEPIVAAQARSAITPSDDDRRPAVPCEPRFPQPSISSSVFGQSRLSSRDSARSASRRPPV